jgi:hypothetical protein
MSGRAWRTVQIEIMAPLSGFIVSDKA